MTKTLTSVLVWALPLLLCLAAAILPAATASQHRIRTPAVRGQSRINRTLKKDNRPSTGAGPNSEVVVSSAFGDEDESLEMLEQEELQLEMELEEQDYTEENGKDKDNKEPIVVDSNDVDAPALSAVKIPNLVLEIGMLAPLATAFSGRASVDYSTSNTNIRTNHVAIEGLMEQYFENLLYSNKDVMGYNYISSNLEATVTWSQNVDGINGLGSIMAFLIKGEVVYQGDPVPKSKDLKQPMMVFFNEWGMNNDLSTYLSQNSIDGARATNFYVDGLQLPAFYQESTSNSASTIPGSTGNSASTTSGTSSGNTDAMPGTVASSNMNGANTTPNTAASTTSTTTTTSSQNTDASTAEPSGSKGNVGLILGSTFFCICLIAVAVMLYSTRRQLFGECGSCCKATRDSVVTKWKKLSSSRGFKDFHEEGSATSPDDDGQFTTKQSSKEGTWKPWFFRKNEEEPSAVLQHIQVVVDNDHVLKKGGYRTHALPEECSGPTIQHSAATVPHDNFSVVQADTISPQKTVTTLGSDDDEKSLEDPVVRYAPPTRSQGKIYRERRHPWRPNPEEIPLPTETTSPTGRIGRPWHESPTVTSSASRVSSYRSAPQPKLVPDDEEEADCDFNGLAELATYLNPCMLPHLPLFQEESERLDDLVKSMPRKNKSLFDGDTDQQEMPPPRRRSSRQARSRTHSSSRSGRKRSHSSRRLAEV